MDKQLWLPKAVALHTAFKAQDKDYNWYIHGGDPLLLEKLMKAAHYALIRDRKGDAPRIIVIAQAERIGLLVGTMRTERRDYVNGIIYDTLYLEFDSQDGAAILSSVATLLAAYDQDNEHREYQQYEKFFLDYAESLAEKGENAQIPTPPPIDLPMYADMASDNCAFDYSEVAVFSTPDSRKKCARYVKRLSDQPHLPKSVTVVSTGRVSKDDLQKYANTHTGGTLLVLTLSDSVQGEIDLRSLREKLPRRLPWIGTVLVFLLGSLFFFTRDRTPPQLASLTFQAPDKTIEALLNSATAPLETLTIPRVGNQGTFVLTFNESIQPKSAPHLTINAGQGNETIPPQSCQPAEPQTWQCPVMFPTDDPNATATITITISDAKDRANNTMQPVDVTSLIESAELQAHVVAITIKNSVGNFIVQATGRYGVAAVHVNTIKAVPLTNSTNQWIVDIPLEPVFQSQQPLMMTITDIYGNTVTSQLF